MKPTACESSTITRASYLSARSQIAFRSAMMPSIEKTPSVAISWNRAPAGLLQLRLQVGHVVVLVAQPLGLAEPDAVDDRGVVQLVGDDRVLGAQDRLEQAAVGVPARGVEDRVLGAQELGDRPLELLVRLLRAADEADRGHAVAPAVERLVRRLHDLGMIGQAEVVVRAHVQNIGRPCDADVRLLGRGEHALALEEAGRADLVELAGQVLLHGAVHGRKAPRLVR